MRLTYKIPALLLLILSLPIFAQGKKATLIVHHAVIHTLDEKNTIAEDTTERFIGTQLIANFDYTVNSFLSFSVEGAWFAAGPFLKEVGSGKDYFYSAVTAQFKF